MLKANMLSFNDEEGLIVPEGLPAVIDTHVHIFPSRILSAIRKWFDANAWHIRYQLTSSEIFEFLLSRKIKHIIALQYAHKPGISQQLNRYMSKKCKEYENRVTGMATVFPGEENAEIILQEAFDSGLGGVKLHSHVQCFDMNSEDMNLIYECCQRNSKPIVMHVGREPKSAAYNCDPYLLCSAEKLECVLKSFPSLKICVPHLGFDETAAYRKLIENYDNLWLDTTMVITNYFSIKEKINLGNYRADRIMYGSDFPNIPYAWDRELNELIKLAISDDAIEKISYKNAINFFSLKL
ncbi:MAG: amidohydrolase [Desulfamplus sp.]|nr:amidohydrolase [Desulfamplus sp.]MBF0388791.1 amidohydrolase [Desulfamplus sp.]